MSTNVREVVVALRDFAEATRAQYQRNLQLFAGAPTPVTQLAPFAAERLTAAQCFTESKGHDGFVILGHVRETNIEFPETEALFWLTNDAVSFDNGARRNEIEGNPALKQIVVLFGERAMARAIYLKALLGGYLRAIDADLFERASKNEENLPSVAAALSQQSIAELKEELEEALPSMTFKREIGDFARTCGFPALPVALAHPLKNHQIIHGLVLSPKLAEQLRAHLAKNQAPAKA